MKALIALALVALLANGAVADNEFHSFLKRLDEAREAGKPFNPASLKVNALAVTYPPAKLSVNNYEFQPANPVANKAFKLTISISNEGYTPFQKKGLMQVWLNYTGNGTESCGATGEKQLKLPPLNPGESKDIKITLKAGTTLGRGQVGVLFDSTCLTWNTSMRVDRYEYKVIQDPVADPQVSQPYSEASKKTSGWPQNPVFAVAGKTATILGEIKNVGSVKFAKGLEAALYFDEDYKLNLKRCAITATPNATTVVKKGAGPGKTASFEFVDVNVGSLQPYFDGTPQSWDFKNAIMVVDPACKVFSNATLGLVGNADINVANSTYPYLTAYIKSVNPKKPKPGATVKVTIGVRNDGTADGKVGSIAAWNDAETYVAPSGGFGSTYNPCGFKNMTVLSTAAADTVVPVGGKEVKVTVEVPAVSGASLWRKMKLMIDANCTLPSPDPEFRVNVDDYLLYDIWYQTKAK